MNCIFLLLLLSCCGGFGSGGSRSGSNCNDASPFTNGNNIGNTFPTVGSGCDYQDATPLSGNNGDCGNPSNWQDYPEIPRRDNCDCDN